MKSGSSNYGGVIQTSNGKEIKFTSTSLADKKALQVGDNVCYQHGIHQTTGLVRAVNVQEWSEPTFTRIFTKTGLVESSRPIGLQWEEFWGF